MAQLVGKVGATVGETTDVHTSQMNPLGTRAFDKDGNEYIYLKGVSSLAAKDWVSFDEAHVTTRLVANAVGRVAVALAAIDAATKFGWFQVYGLVNANCAALFADNGKVFSTATPGVVDDAVVTGDLIVGAIGRSAISGSSANFELSYPFATDVLG